MVPDGHPADGSSRAFAGPGSPLASIAVVVVLYNSADVIEECLASVPAEAEVIVVDNASDDGGAEIALATRPDAVLIRSERNLGFGAGCNAGWRASTREYVAFVNPDVRLRATTLTIMVERASQHPHAIVGPALLDASGAVRLCKRGSSALLDFLSLLPAAARWAPEGIDGKVERDAGVHATGGQVACVEGACFMVARHDLEAVGGFDEDFFLYQEEETLALRLARLGGCAFYEPAAVAEHAGGTSTKKIGALATEQMYRSRVIFYRKRDGELRGMMSALLLALGVLLSLPGAVLNLALGRRRHVTPGERWHVLRGLAAGTTARLHGRLGVSALQPAAPGD